MGCGGAGHHDAGTGGQTESREGCDGASGVVVAGVAAGGPDLQKKTLLDAETKREDVRRARDEWKAHRQPCMREGVHRLVFLDETGTTTKMTRLRGRARRGVRLKADAPFGHWATQTFIARLRCNGLTEPWVIDHPINRQTFDTYIETQLAPTLQAGDVVIPDNLSSHKNAKAEAVLKQR